MDGGEKRIDKPGEKIHIDEPIEIKKIHYLM